ncbi:MAG: hypothetical protein OHK0029_06770 [Armatimonadaceae bacterium]
MADTKQSDSPPTNSMGLKAFNQTGREETTTNIIRPKKDPKVQQRNILLTVAIVIFFVVAAGIAFSRSGLNLNEIFSAESGGTFGTAEVQQNFESDN